MLQHGDLYLFSKRTRSYIDIMGFNVLRYLDPYVYIVASQTFLIKSEFHRFLQNFIIRRQIYINSAAKIQHSLLIKYAL